MQSRVYCVYHVLFCLCNFCVAIRDANVVLGAICDGNRAMQSNVYRVYSVSMHVMCNPLGNVQCNPMCIVHSTCIVHTGFNLGCAIIKVNHSVNLLYSGNTHAISKECDNAGE